MLSVAERAVGTDRRIKSQGELRGVAEPDRTSYRPIRVIGLLLILEVIGLIGLGLYEAARVDWQRVNLENPARGVIEAKNVLIATNGYSGPAFPWIRRRVIPFDAYMIATERLSPDLPCPFLESER